MLISIHKSVFENIEEAKKITFSSSLLKIFKKQLTKIAHIIY